ncbi:MAG: hypothetical protein IJU96_06575 [Clostridia bacterium]|nr:hypothetical protein [Clostridia bacterium]
MSFVDELNNMPSTKNRAIEQYKKELEGIHGWIKQECISHNTDKYLKGYIAFYHDTEFGVSGFEFIDSLEVNPPKETATNSRLKRGYRYTSACKVTQNGQYTPMSPTPDGCRIYITDLKKLLTQDGFKSIIINVVPCYESYYVVDYVGFLSPKLTFKKQQTNKVLGYVLQIELSW